jgi:hypothetical protein
LQNGGTEGEDNGQQFTEPEGVDVDSSGNGYILRIQVIILYKVFALESDPANTHSQMCLHNSNNNNKNFFLNKNLCTLEFIPANIFYYIK